jgi:folate-binding protein YgfZ
MAAPRELGARDVVTVAGPDALSYLQSQLSQEVRDLPVGADRWTLLLSPNGRVEVLARVRRTAEEAFELDTDAGWGQALLERLQRFKIRVRAELSLDAAQPPDVDAAQSADIERMRIEAGWPRMGAEIVPGETIPAETGVAAVAVSFTKGCYPGQELVERMDSRAATAPRSLRRLTVEPGASPGDPITAADGSPVGTITSVSGMTALGYVKRGADVGLPVDHDPVPKPTPEN